MRSTSKGQPIHQTQGAKTKRSLLNAVFVGMWRDREDMVDSSKWVRRIRQQEWTRRWGARRSICV